MCARCQSLVLESRDWSGGPGVQSAGMFKYGWGTGTLGFGSSV